MRHQFEVKTGTGTDIFHPLKQPASYLMQHTELFPHKIRDKAERPQSLLVITRVEILEVEIRQEK